VYRDESRLPETVVTDLSDSVAGSTMSDAVPSSAGPPPVDGSTTVEPESVEVPGRPSSVCADNKNCSAREAIVRSSQISALLAAKTFRW